MCLKRSRKYRCCVVVLARGIDPWSCPIFKDFAFCKLAVMYDHVTSINSVTATVHEDTVKNNLFYLLNAEVNFKFMSMFQSAHVIFYFFMTNKVSAVVQFACHRSTRSDLGPQVTSTSNLRTVNNRGHTAVVFCPYGRFPSSLTPSWSVLCQHL